MDPISLTTTSIQLDIQRLNSIANNVANALTPGYKREFITSAGQFDYLLSSQATQPVLSAIVDNKPGVQMQTSNPLDLSLSEIGYFEVMTDDGYAYTRQGAFKLDEKGMLVNKVGQPVSGISGEIYLTTSNPIIDSEGKIFENDKLVAQLKIVSFNSPETLLKIGGGLFIPSSESYTQLIEHPRVSQGSLESSNVDSAQEMVNLIETYRHFEASHKVIQAYDELNEKTLQNLSQF
ncbi:MAG: flagellar hook-basal body protein [Methylotenera sp.]